MGARCDVQHLCGKPLSSVAGANAPDAAPGDSKEDAGASANKAPAQISAQKRASLRAQNRKIDDKQGTGKLNNEMRQRAESVAKLARARSQSQASVAANVKKGEG